MLFPPKATRFTIVEASTRSSVVLEYDDAVSTVDTALEYHPNIKNCSGIITRQEK